MIEITFHGRGGQGAVTAAQILATAAFREGKYSHALPNFRAERKGAPVQAYVRISEQPMEVRAAVDAADIILVLDNALMKTVRPLNNLKTNGSIIINASSISDEIKNATRDKGIKVYAVNATAISEKIYGQSSIPRVNVVMLGLFSAFTKAVKMESILSAVSDYFTGTNAVKAKEGAELAYSLYKENL
jgi:2-oxoacid:acceptor oxidoreductase gamma subunit (pyruvate/2-ketoisovalerate family)